MNPVGWVINHTQGVPGSPSSPQITLFIDYKMGPHMDSSLSQNTQKTTSFLTKMDSSREGGPSMGLSSPYKVIHRGGRPPHQGRDSHIYVCSCDASWDVSVLFSRTLEVEPHMPNLPYDRLVIVQALRSKSNALAYHSSENY